MFYINKMIVTLSSRSNVNAGGDAINAQSAQAYRVQFAKPILLPIDAEVTLISASVNKNTVAPGAGSFPLTDDYNSVILRIPELNIRSAQVKDANSNQLLEQSCIGRPIDVGAARPATAADGEVGVEVNNPIYQRIYNQDDRYVNELTVEFIHVDSSPAKELTLNSEVTIHIRKHGE